METLNLLLIGLKLKDVKSIILKELDEVDMEFVKKALDDNYQLDWSLSYYAHFKNYNYPKLEYWFRQISPKCQYIMPKGTQCCDPILCDGSPDSLRYCENCYNYVLYSGNR